MSTAVATPTRISRMRTPAGRDGQHFENEYFQYLTPESFTVLPPEAGQPNPSRAPEPYKLTPRKRHKNQSFSIIAEPGLSAPNSRAGSPTGRVSPFRGRGFNPTGSRHASPAPSPPPGGESPDDETILQHSKELTNQLRKSSIGRSQIPVLSSRKILSPQDNNLHARFSKSMVNIAPRNLVRKPPPSPRKSNLKSFVRLSPIIGSSPEAGSDQTSSPSRIPRSRSQPPSRITSPSRNTSREVSPQGSPTKIPQKSVFKNIPAKVETFNRIVSASKPKVPQKPRVYATRTNSVRKNVKIANNRSPRREMEDTETTDSEIVKDTAKNKTRLTVRRNSINRNNNSTFSKPKSVKTKNDYEKPSTSKNSTKKESNNNDKNKNESNNNDKNKNESINNDKSTVQNEKTNKTNETNKTNSQTFRKEDNGAKQNKTKKNEEINKSDEETTEDARDDDILSVTIDEIIGSQTTKIVSATAETVVKPLNIEAKLITKTETTTDNSTNSNSANSTTQQKNAINNNSGSATSNTIPTPANGSVVNTPPNNLSEHNLTPSLTPSLNASSESVNNLKHVSNSLTPSVNSLEMNPKNNFNNLTPPDSDKVSNKSLMDSGNVTKLSNSTNVTNSGKVKGRTVIVDEIKPIKITVRERSGDIEVQSGNVLPRSATNGVAERPLIPPSNHPQNSDSPPPEGTTQTGPCSKIFSCCGKPNPTPGTADGSTVSGVHALGSEEGKKSPCWEKMCCRKSGRVGDVHASRFSCFPRLGGGKNEGSWAERRDSILSEPPKKQPFSLKRVLCAPFSKCKKKKPEEIVESRRPSMLSKKKSLSSTMQPPPEDTGPKLDASLVEHTSHMRGAIPILPIPLAWICLVLNIFIPGTGTILSGILCLCLGIPRFSPRDTAKARVGAFLIDIVVGISQCFTVLFCLVGWGWSIWWGVIMHKIAKKYKKIKKAEENAIEEVEDALPTVNINKATQQRDVEKGKS